MDPNALEGQFPSANHGEASARFDSRTPPPPPTIRTELNDAVLSGIRERGPEAVGLLLVGLVRVVIAAITLALFFCAGSVMGFEITAAPFAAATGALAGLSWLMTKRRPGVEMSLPFDPPR